MNFHIGKLSTFLPSLFNFTTSQEHRDLVNNPNLETIHIYNEEYLHYLENTPSQYPGSYNSMLEWIENSLQAINTGGKVLEIGSATPRDANFIRSLGYRVQCSDATPNFVRHMNSKDEPAILLNILTDKIQGKYDMVFANAVFPHFTDNEIIVALKNIREGLGEGGIICFNVKEGTGETWIQEKTISRRYTNYQQPDHIKKLVQESGYEILYFKDGCIGDPPTHVWTRITARKISLQ